ncbi:UDP-glucose 4-epimerase GalE [Brevundimonas sp.]|uniref:UDP-glucose 4-epimerase GalE n=1 Tax=Brevundimonas sp. TaxID=1871086 RepID=UPI003A8DFA6D
MKNSVLVTGGAGYIGSHAVLALLERGFTPVIIDDLSTGVREAVPEGADLYLGDVGDKRFVSEILRERRPHAVMHFAGSIVVEESVRNPTKYFRNNTSNTLTLIEAWLVHGGGPFIFSSTAAVYGMPGSERVSEDAPKVPISPYGASKWLSEMMIRDTAAAHPAFRSVCLRYFNVAGADPAGRTGQRGPQSTHLIRVAIEVALGLRERMSVFGLDYDTRDGTCERDFIHVTDLADAHVAALDYLQAGGAPATFNCGYGRGYTVLEVLSALEQILGRPVAADAAPRRPGDPARLISDPSAIQRSLAWTPRRADLVQILESALAWQAKLGAG